MDRLTPGLIALVVGFVLAFALLIPFIALSYRRRGGLTPARTVAWLALLLWVLGMWAYTLLPLPDAGYRCVGVILNPLDGFRDIFTDGRAAIEQLVLNVALFVPWGVLVRALWARGVLVAGATGALLSLGVELTQVTGVWGVLPCAYRFFDTGDLLTNTFGAVLGSLISIPFLKQGLRRPRGTDRITLSRRIIGFASDAIMVFGTTAVISIGMNTVQKYLFAVPSADLNYDLSSWVAGVSTFVAFGALVLATGTTPGEAAVDIVGVDGRAPVLPRRALRYVLGIGGYQVLSALPAPGGILAFGFLVATVVVAWKTDNHRGLAATASGMNVRLGREVRAETQPASHNAL